jgi:pilus assembly protein CpaE
VLADLDLSFGTAALNFNQEPSNGLADAISSNGLDAALVDRLLTRCSDKLSLLAAPATVDRIHTANDEFFDGLMEILRATTPMIVLDVPAVWTSDEIVLVATPELACLRNAKNLYDVLRAARPNDAPPRIVLNMVGVPKRTEISLADFTRAIETQPVSSIPFDPKVFGTAANNGQMLAEIADAAKINEILFDLARVLTGRMEARPVKKPSLLAPLTSLLARPKKAS